MAIALRGDFKAYQLRSLARKRPAEGLKRIPTYRPHNLRCSSRKRALRHPSLPRLFGIVRLGHPGVSGKPLVHRVAVLAICSAERIRDLQRNGG